MSLVVNRASMTGFVVTDYAARFDQAAGELGGWRASGRLRSREDIADGLETFPETLLRAPAEITAWLRRRLDAPDATRSPSSTTRLFDVARTTASSCCA
jgi:hypothetical protein